MRSGYMRLFWLMLFKTLLVKEPIFEKQQEVSCLSCMNAVVRFLNNVSSVYYYCEVNKLISFFDIFSDGLRGWCV